MNTHTKNKLKIFLIITVLANSGKTNASLQDLYETVIDSTEKQNLARTDRINKRFPERPYQGTGKILAESIQKRAAELFQQLEVEQKAQVEQLAKAQEELKVANQRAEELQVQLAKRSAEIQKEESGKTEQAHQVLVKEKDDLTAINKLLQQRVTELEEGYQKYLQELIQQINNMEPTVPSS